VASLGRLEGEGEGLSISLGDLICWDFLRGSLLSALEALLR
tara:strand:+ start:3395 stop:3517 length:123 start_codon:yes stop_codon:yes gene_type:complete